MNPNFKKNVDEKDITGVRVALAAELLQDPRGNSFDEMLKYAEATLDNLYETDDGQNKERPIAEWNQDYLFDLKTDLDFNFSKEKLKKKKKVAQEVLKAKARHLDEEERKSEETKTTPKEEPIIQSSRTFERKHVYTGVTVGGVVLAIVGLCATKTALTIICAGAAAVGGYMLYKELHK